MSNGVETQLGPPNMASLQHDFLELYLTPTFDVIPPPGPPVIPTITLLNPATAPANKDVTVQITGTGFSMGVTVQIGIAFGLVPISITPTLLIVVFGAINIAQAGTLPVKVVNTSGQPSNSLNFIVT